MPSKQKELMVQALTEKFKSNDNMVLTEYRGLTVDEISELRKKLRTLKCEYTIVKNTLTKRVLKEMGLEEFSNYFEGPNAVALENGDLVATAKILVDFSKDHKKLVVKAGKLKDKVLTSQDIKSLASLPSREVLLARAVGVIISPLSGLVNVLQCPIRNLVYVLDQIKSKKPQ